jgi:cell wall assembly regulator SMI1
VRLDAASPLHSLAAIIDHAGSFACAYPCHSMCRWEMIELALRSRLVSSRNAKRGQKLAPSGVFDVWERIKCRLAGLSPELLKALAPPASDAAISKLTKIFGEALPDSLVQSWSLHNGQSLRSQVSLPLFFGFRFLSVAQTQQMWKQLQPTSLSEADLPDADFLVWRQMVKRGIGKIYGAVKACDANKKWLPISAFDGRLVRFIDFDPAPGGRKGQIIEIDSADASWRVIANSFEDLLQKYERLLARKNACLETQWNHVAIAKGYMPPYLKKLVYKSVSIKQAAQKSTSISELGNLPIGTQTEITCCICLIVGRSSEMQLLLKLKNGDKLLAQANGKKTKGYNKIAIGEKGRAVIENLGKRGYLILAFC